MTEMLLAALALSGDRTEGYRLFNVAQAVLLKIAYFQACFKIVFCEA